MVTPAQQNIANQVLAEADKQGATAIQKLALMEAGLAESGMANLTYGDRDSQGIFQERPSQGWHDVTNIAAATDQILAAMKRSPNQTDPGAIAQFAEKSANPGSYNAQRSGAQALLSGAGPAGASDSAGTGTADTSGATSDGGIGAFVSKYAVKFGLCVFGGAIALVGVWVCLGHPVQDIPLVGKLARPSGGSGTSRTASSGRTPTGSGRSSGGGTPARHTAGEQASSGGVDHSQGLSGWQKGPTYHGPSTKGYGAKFGRGTSSVPGPNAVIA